MASKAHLCGCGHEAVARSCLLHKAFGDCDEQHASKRPALPPTDARDTVLRTILELLNLALLVLQQLLLLLHLVPQRRYFLGG